MTKPPTAKQTAEALKIVKALARRGQWDFATSDRGDKAYQIYLRARLLLRQLKTRRK